MIIRLSGRNFRGLGRRIVLNFRYPFRTKLASDQHRRGGRARWPRMAGDDIAVCHEIDFQTSIASLGIIISNYPIILRLWLSAQD